jgi:hypothetical protein
MGRHLKYFGIHREGFNLTDTHSIYLARHLCTFILFFVAVVLFFHAAKKYLRDNSRFRLLFVLSP